MSKRLPELIHPLRLAASSGRLHGVLPLAGMSRLLSNLDHDGGDVEIDLQFGQGRSGRAQVRGRVKAALSLSCQRCLESMPFHVDARVDLIIAVSGEETERVEGDDEVLMVRQDSVSLTTLVEDELILSLPAFPAHPEDACAGPVGYVAEAEPSETKRENPFAVLASTMRQTSTE